MVKRYETVLVAVVILLAVPGCDRGEKSTALEPAGEPTVAVPAGPSGNYRVPKIEAPLTVGESEDVELTIEPKSGFKINLEYPWSFQLEQGDGATPGATSLDSDAIDLTEARASLPVSVTANRSGDVEIEAVGNFSVCNEKKCDRYTEERVTFALVARDE